MKKKFMQDQLSMFSLAELRANLSPWLASEKVWLIRVVTWPSSFLELLKQSIPDGLSGRMFPVCCQALTDETSVPFSVVWRNSGMGSATECWTQDISESHNHGVECTLSAILETGGQLLRYSLSPIACAGTLHRNSVTPLKLKNALEAVSRSVSCGSQDSEVLALEKTSAEL
jgi:hypothetical protein